MVFGQFTSYNKKVTAKDVVKKKTAPAPASTPKPSGGGSSGGSSGRSSSGGGRSSSGSGSIPQQGYSSYDQGVSSAGVPMPTMPVSNTQIANLEKQGYTFQSTVQDGQGVIVGTKQADKTPPQTYKEKLYSDYGFRTTKKMYIPPDVNKTQQSISPGNTSKEGIVQTDMFGRVRTQQPDPYRVDVYDKKKVTPFVSPRGGEYKKADLFFKIEKTSEKVGYEYAAEKGASKWGAGVSLFATSFVTEAARPFARPVEFIKGTAKAAWSPFETIEQTATSFLREPVKTSGGFLGTAASFKVMGKGGKIAKQEYIKFGAERIEPSKVFAEEVLSGGKTLPTSPSIASSVKEFERSKGIVSTASPAKIKGTTADVGKKASLGLEDPGIYVTPKGKGSPYFLRVDKNIPKEYTFSLNPFKDTFGIPTVTEIKTAGVARLPPDVIKKPGFGSVAEFQKTSAEPGKVYITKRSEIGQGEVSSQLFKSPEGKLVKEAGTKELEGVIPVGQQFKYTPKTFLGRVKGFDKYTEYKGEPIALREARLLYDSPSTVKSTGTGMSRIISGKKISSESSYLMSRSKAVSPLSALKYVQGSSSTGVSKGSSRLISTKSPVSPSSSRIFGSKGKSILLSSNNIYSAKPPKGGYFSTSKNKSSSSRGGISIGESSYYGGSSTTRKSMTPSIGKGSPIKLPSDSPKKRMGMGMTRTLGRKTAYSPTLWAVAGKMKSPKIKGKLTGFELRGVDQ